MFDDLPSTPGISTDEHVPGNWLFFDSLPNRAHPPKIRGETLR
jgi:hypothetical protein